MERITYSKIWSYEVSSLRRNTDNLEEAYKVLHDYVMSLDIPFSEFRNLSEALASLYTSAVCLKIDVEHIEKREKKEL